MTITIEEAVIACHRVLHIDAAGIAMAYAGHGMTLEKVKAIIAASEAPVAGKPRRKTGPFPSAPLVTNGVNGVHAKGLP